MKVVRLSKSICDEFVSKKHYSRRPSIFWEGFGLEESGKITGVVVYGQPSPAIQKHAFIDRDFRFFELSRIVIQSKTKNAASFLISNSIKMIDKLPCAIISYSDTEQNHCGIVYQATNWLYTGATMSHDKQYIVDGKKMHPMSLRDIGITDPTRWAKENNIEMVKPMIKHRYFQFAGSKIDKKNMINKLKYKIVSPYPKCNKTMYDDGPQLDINTELSLF